MSYSLGDFTEDEIEIIIEQLRSIKGVGLADTDNHGVILFHHPNSFFDDYPKEFHASMIHVDEELELESDQEDEPARMQFILQFEDPEGLESENYIREIVLICLPIDEVEAANTYIDMLYDPGPPVGPTYYMEGLPYSMS